MIYVHANDREMKNMLSLWKAQRRAKELQEELDQELSQDDSDGVNDDVNDNGTSARNDNKTM